MTELMKRYEADTGECATWTWHEREFLTDDYIAWLESQLRWRPVSEKPKEGQKVIGVNKDSISTVVWYEVDEDGPYFIDDDGFEHGAIHWLPIPPAPEGE